MSFSGKSQLLLATVVLHALSLAAPAQESRPADDEYYRLVRIPIPEEIVLEVGGLEQLPDGRLAVATRRGEIYLVDGAFAESPDDVRFTRFAHGLHEVLGLAWRDGWLYATQRGEVSRLQDTDGDDVADVLETVCDGWSISGDYHEYAFGSRFDPDGHMWVVLCLTGSFSSEVPYRGWCVRVTSDGELIPTASGLRSPGGIGMNHLGDVFYTDNQGPWNGTCSLKHLARGSFQGHPGGNRWYELPEVKQALGAAPAEPASGSRTVVEAAKIPEYYPAAVLFPYDKMGKSASGIACDTTGGAFGPFKNQLFVGDQAHSTVMRCFLEKVAGRWQGACFMFREGFGSGTLPLMFARDGSLVAGGTNRGWGSRGHQPFALERIVWTGKVPFEIHEMRAKPDGFELTFTEPVDRETAADPGSYELTTYTYIFQSSYGSPEVDHTTPTIEQVVVAESGTSVRLYVQGLQPGHVHELHAAGLRSASGRALLHDVGYYTLNALPEAE